MRLKAPQHSAVNCVWERVSNCCLSQTSGVVWIDLNYLLFDMVKERLPDIEEQEGP